jgi:hypothetical protein
MSRLIFGVVSFRLSDKTKDRGFADVSFRKLLARNNSSVTNNEQQNPGNIRMEGVDSLASANIKTSNEIKADGPKIQSNRFDSIIEQLEKKYSNPVLISSNSVDGSDGGSGSTEDEEDGDGDGKSDTGNMKDSGGYDGESKKRKRGTHGKDAYDMEDSFIDDEDMCEELEVAYRSQKVKTKHSGFFVNSGILEVVSIDNEKVVHPSDATDYTTNTTSKKYRIMKKPDIIIAFGEFAEAIKTTAARVNKQRFPIILIPALMELDKHAVDQKIQGDGEYFSWISDCLGGFPASKVKNQLLLCRKQARAIAARSEVDKLCTMFCDEMLPRIKRAQPSEAMTITSLDDEFSQIGGTQGTDEGDLSWFTYTVVITYQVSRIPRPL